MHFSQVVIVLLASFAWLLTNSQAYPDATKPNIVFILADDVGVNDLSLYGSKFFETPQIDRLASDGVKFTQAYSASPLCSPTRASIMTASLPGADRDHRSRLSFA